MLHSDNKTIKITKKAFFLKIVVASVTLYCSISLWISLENAFPSSKSPNSLKYVDICPKYYHFQTPCFGGFKFMKHARRYSTLWRIIQKRKEINSYFLRQSWRPWIGPPNCNRGWLYLLLVLQETDSIFTVRAPPLVHIWKNRKLGIFSCLMVKP